MKTFKLFFILMSMTYFGFADGNISNQKIESFDKLFESINETRLGISDESISKIKDPFISNFHINSNETNDTTKVKQYKLNALLNNRARINNQWYTIKEKVGSYTLTRIKNNSVILKNLSHEIELNLHKGSKNVNISIK